jgi:hypothetical protein
LFSVILAVSALWARIDFDLSILPRRLRSIIRSSSRSSDKEKPLDKQGNFSHPEIFFSYSAHRYLAQDKKEAKEQGKKYFNEQIKKFASKKELVKAMAAEITILSSNVNKKYQLINLSFVLVAVSFGLLSAIVILTYAYRIY